jgi:predicted nucleotidyltransferase
VASSWVKYHFQHLRRWREYAEKVAEAAASIDPEAEVYVVGGVAEGRATVLSDIDVLVVLSKPQLSPAERRRLAVRILEEAIARNGLPWDAPVEVHVAGRMEARRLLERGKAVRIR